MTTFLDPNYKVPQSNKNYFKFQQGNNDFRIMSSAIVGYIYWTEDKKPVRLREMWKKKPTDIRVEKNGSYSTKHFWSFIVWNYEMNCIQIMEITQKTIMNAIKALVDNSKWGSPTEYDVTISKVGEGLETEYSVVPNPKTDVQQEILDEFKAKPANLELLFENGDPFEPSNQEKTQEQLDEEEEVLKACDKL